MGRAFCDVIPSVASIANVSSECRWHKARPTRDVEYADVFGCVVVINRHSRFNAGSASAWFPVFVDCCKIRVGKDSVAEIENLLKVVVPVIRFTNCSEVC
jgi:hypothetical protein